jgi:hypothetical protein
MKQQVRPGLLPVAAAVEDVILKYVQTHAEKTGV